MKTERPSIHKLYENLSDINGSKTQQMKEKHEEFDSS